MDDYYCGLSRVPLACVVVVVVDDDDDDDDIFV